MTKSSVILADLTHTALGISALSFPLGAAYVASYAQHRLGETLSFSLHKYPDQAVDAILAQKPKVLGLSNYAWNFQLSIKLAEWTKKTFPDTIIVFGGPNFPIDPLEKEAFLSQHPVIDFYVQNEGEVGFAELLTTLQDFDFALEDVVDSRPLIKNCCYLAGDCLVAGDVDRIRDVNDIPSPYLTGVLDEFFDEPLAPMIETTRGCPFSCAFCADGLKTKNKVVRYEAGRVQKELEYIHGHIKNIDELIITDLNFGMYKQDRATAEFIADLQKHHQWPRVVKASAGKNQPKRILETAELLKGSWVIGSAVQSTDDEVLANIKRSNISTDVFRQFIDFANRQSDSSQSYTEIILGLPGDTKEKHFASLRSGIENKVSTLRMYQAMLLMGTDLASQETREKFELQTKHRILPGGIGTYSFGEDKVPVVETEEIIVGSKDMPFEDYVSCRVMNLLVETYINNGLFEEIFAALKAMGVNTFDVLLQLSETINQCSPKVRDIITGFVEETANDLYDSREEAEEFACRSENMEKYLSGELGANELLEHRALMYLELGEIADHLLNAAQAVAETLQVWDENTAEYFAQLKSFVIQRKMGIHENFQVKKNAFNYDFKAVSLKNFAMDPRKMVYEDQTVNIQFFHTLDQKKYIQNTVNLYKNHPGGIGRMIQRSNLKMMYRNFDYA